MQIILRSLLFLTLLILTGLQTACHRGNFANPRPHEEAQGQLESQDTQTKKRPFAHLREATDLEDLGRILLSPPNLSDSDIYLDDDFEYSLFRFQEMVLKEIESPKSLNAVILKRYRVLFLETCDFNFLAPCTPIKTLSRHPQSHKVALWMAENALKEGKKDEYWKLVQVSVNLRGKGFSDPTLALYFAENIQRVRGFIQKEEPPRVAQWNSFLSSLFLEITRSGDINNIKDILENIEPEKLDVTRTDPIQFDRQILLGAWSAYYKEHSSELKTRLSRFLKSERKSLYFSHHKDGLFKNHTPSVDLCTFLMDRVFTGALDTASAQNMFKELTNGEVCHDKIQSYLLARILYHSSLFFKDIKAINESIANKQVANADLLENLKNRMPDYGKQWEEILSASERVVDMSTIAFADGDFDTQKDLRDLKKSMRKNVVMYIQFPMNLSFLSVLNSFRNQSFGQYSILTNNIATLIKKLIDRGDYFLDFGLLDQSQRRLSYPEILMSFDFAVYSNIFESVGSSDLDVLTSIAENLEIGAYNLITRKLPDYYRQYEGNAKHSVYPLCLGLSEVQKGKKAQPLAKWDMTLKRVSGNPINPWDETKGTYFNTYSQIHEDYLDKIQQDYLVGLQPIRDFSTIIKKHKNIDMAKIDQILTKRKAFLKPYISWIEKGIAKDSSCFWGYMKESWKAYRMIIKYETEFLGLIHDEMTRLREESDADPTKANKQARIFLEGTPLDRDEFFDKDNFQYYSVAFYLRMAGYLEQGAFGKKALAPYLSIENNFNEFSQKKMAEKSTFPYQRDKRRFVEQILHYLMLPTRTGGIWSANFSLAGYGDMSSVLGLYSRLYLLNPDLFETKSEINVWPLVTSVLRPWDASRLVEQEDEYDDLWILNSKNLFEKFGNFADPSGALAGLYFRNEETRAPLHSLIANILVEERPYPADYDTGDGGDETPEPVPTATDYVINYYRDRSSMPTSLYPYDSNILAASDAFHNKLITHRFEKIKDLACNIKTMATQHLASINESDPLAIGDTLSLKFKSYEGPFLIEDEDISNINTAIYNFLQKIPEDMRKSGPAIPLIEKCREPQE